MIRPCRFYPNPETAADNTFQQSTSELDRQELCARACQEFDNVVAVLRDHGVVVHAIQDSVSSEKPDAVFPNNWISTHADGRIALYPMFSKRRRRERRLDVVDVLRQYYRVCGMIDYSGYEATEQYLEGTGSIVLDRINRRAYVSLSQRSHFAPLQQFCADFSLDPGIF